MVADWVARWVAVLVDQTVGLKAVMWAAQMVDCWVAVWVAR